jgi:hypothetical protein
MVPVSARTVQEKVAGLCKTTEAAEADAETL